jgi:hypothetical protein
MTRKPTECVGVLGAKVALASGDKFFFHNKPFKLTAGTRQQKRHPMLPGILEI